ncbi:hypothetical protein EDEG_05104, partial [Edhazardia aedis USNM 41457]
AEEKCETSSSSTYLKKETNEKTYIIENIESDKIEGQKTRIDDIDNIRITTIQINLCKSNSESKLSIQNKHNNPKNIENVDEKLILQAKTQKADKNAQIKQIIVAKVDQKNLIITIEFKTANNDKIDKIFDSNIKEEFERNCNIKEPVFLHGRNKNGNISQKPISKKILKAARIVIDRVNEKINKQCEILKQDRNVSEMLNTERKMDKGNINVEMKKIDSKKCITPTKHQENLNYLQQNKKNSKKTFEIKEINKKSIKSESRNLAVVSNNLNSYYASYSKMHDINKKIYRSKQSDNQTSIKFCQIQKPENIKTQFANKIEESFYVQLICLRQIYDFLIKLCCLYTYRNFYDFNFLEMKTPKELFYNAIIENSGVISIESFTSRYNFIFMKSLRWFYKSNIAGEMKEKFVDCISEWYRNQKFNFYFKNLSKKSKHRLNQYKKSLISKNLRIHLKSRVDKIAFDVLYSKITLLKRHHILKRPLFPFLIDKRFAKQQKITSKDKYSLYDHALFVRLQIFLIIRYIRSPILKCLFYFEIDSSTNIKNRNSSSQQIKTTNRQSKVISQSNYDLLAQRVHFIDDEITKISSKFAILIYKTPFTTLLNYFVFFDNRNTINIRYLTYYDFYDNKIKNILCKFNLGNTNSFIYTKITLQQKELKNNDNNRQKFPHSNINHVVKLKSNIVRNNNCTNSFNGKMNEIISSNEAMKKISNYIAVPKHRKNFKFSKSFEKKNDFKKLQVISNHSSTHQKSNSKISTGFKLGFCLTVLIIFVSGIFLD